MEGMQGSNYNIYKDIQQRTGGEIYIGVVGPVRTGKSTFIKRFMDMLVIPKIEDVHSRERAVDELPQSAAGRTIMTTEPKFIPKEAAVIGLDDETKVKVRLIDCVGYMVEGAQGHIEDDEERMVKTPWFTYEIPFTQAAELGTKKVINDHSTIGIVVTSDGSFGELDRRAYEQPEEKTISELKAIGKPFVVVLNTIKPYSEDAKNLAAAMEEKYGVSVIPINCEQLRAEDISRIMESVLLVFPVSEVSFYMPKWADMLSSSHPVKQELGQTVGQLFAKMNIMKDLRKLDLEEGESDLVKKCRIEKISLEDGSVSIRFDLNDRYYYDIISDIMGMKVGGEYELIKNMKELAAKRDEFDRFADAYSEVRSKGYGVVTPRREEIMLEEPELIKHGAKYGVKIKASAPSVNMISAVIETEIAPIVGTQQQAEDLIGYIKAGAASDDESIKDALIFGKSIGALVEEGIDGKIAHMTDECQMKLQETLQKIINESSAGVVFVII